MKAFTNQLLYYRRCEGINQSELADRLGVTEKTIANYENGRTEPTMDMVIRLAHALNITTDQLLAFELPIK